MAFTAAARTRTTSSTSRTKTSNASGPTSSRAPVASGSGSRRSSASTSAPPTARTPADSQDGDGSDDSDSDFDRELHEQARIDRKKIRQEKELKEAKEERKRYKDRGEEVPQEIKETIKRLTKKKEKVFKDDQQAVFALAQGKAAADGLKWKGKARESSPDSDHALSSTKPTLNRAAKRAEVAKRTGLKVFSAGDESEDNDLVGANDVMAAVASQDDPEVVRKHLSRRWVDRKHPDRMTDERRALEEKYNPLIKLLNVRIIVVQGGKAADSGEERKHSRGAAILVQTDDELDSDSDGVDWNSDGMGAYKNVIKLPPRPPRPAVKTEPAVATARHNVLRSPAPALTAVKQEPDPGSEKIVVVTDSEPEPDTEDDDVEMKPVEPDKSSGVAEPSQAKPQMAPTQIADGDDGDSEPEPDTEEDDAPPTTFFFPSPLHQNSDARLPAEPSQAKPQMAPMQIDDGGDDDSEPEPDTEPDDYLPPAGYLASVPPSSNFQVRQPGQAFGSSQGRASSQSQADSQQLRLSSAGGPPVKVESQNEVMVDDDSENLEDDMSRALKARLERVARQKEAAAAKKRQEEADARKEEQRRVMQEQIAAGLRELQASGQSFDFPSDDEDDEEEARKRELAVQAGRVQYPKPPARKTRPHFQINDAVQERTGSHSLSKDPSDTAKIPAPINRFLRQYQREGAEFLYGQYKQGLGGILGDDMGLGKTIQAIAFLAAIMGKTGLRKMDKERRKKAVQKSQAAGDDFKPSDLGPTCLIVCPASVMENWARELETWGYFDVEIYSGDQKQRVLKQYDRGYLDIVIAGFEAVRRNIDDLAARDFTVVIADEAHRLKSPKASITKAMQSLPTRLRYGLTGTAIQNRLSELWCLLHWAVPGRVGTYAQWRDLVTKPIAWSQRADAPDNVIATGRIRATALVSNLLPKFFMRRTKEKVKLQLPPKTDHIVLCPLTKLQQEVYRRLLKLNDVEVMLTADDPCPCGELDEEGLPYRRGNCCEQGWAKLIFKYIVLFQKVANHLGLIYPDREDLMNNKEKYIQDQNWMRAAFPEDYLSRKSYATAVLDPELCGKWKILRKLLHLWHKNGDKVLIFSMSLKILSFLEELMNQTRYEYLVLDGSTPQEDRMPLVDEFNDPESDKFCFLISTKAGGVGLNLTAANRVVIFDPNWNPAHDLQAMDRAYRIGQKREVDVYRLIGAGTLEELIYNRQQYKRAIASLAYDASAERRLFTGVQDEGKENAGELFGVKNMFRMQDHLSLTEMSIYRADLAEIEFALQNTNLLDSDNDKLLVADDPNPEDVVKQLTGYAHKAKKTGGVSAKEAERQRAHAKEQEEIASILDGTRRVQSDAVLGGSSIEALRARTAVKAQQEAKTQGRRSLPSEIDRQQARPSKAPPPPPPAATSNWQNVLARRKRPLETDAQPSKKVKGEPQESTFASALIEEGVPADVSTAEVIAAAGYQGARGGRKLLLELEALDAAGKRALLGEVVRKWREQNRA